jgi:hypothetical protein
VNEEKEEKIGTLHVSFLRCCGSVNISSGFADPLSEISGPDPGGQLITDPAGSEVLNCSLRFQIFDEYR